MSVLAVLSSAHGPMVIMLRVQIRVSEWTSGGFGGLAPTKLLPGGCCSYRRFPVHSSMRPRSQAARLRFELSSPMPIVNLIAVAFQLLVSYASSLAVI